MAAPYVCSTCRSNLLRPSLNIVRSISQTTKYRQTAQARDDPNPRYQNPRGNYANGRSGLAAYENSNGNGTARGRYSGKELRPEQLLNQLGTPGEEFGNRERHARQRQTLDAPNTTDGHRERPSHYARLSPRVKQLAEAFIAQCTDADFANAWHLLQELGKECNGLSSNEARTLFTLNGMGPALGKLLSAASRQWLRELAGTKSPVELPPPLDIHKTLFRLRGTNPSLYQPTLWHTSFGIADMQFALAEKPIGMKVIQNAVSQLVQMWRICMAVQASNSAGPATTFDSETRFELSDDATDWSFLPSMDTFAPRKLDDGRWRSFESILYMLVPMPPQRGGEKRNNDYASAALITLDLLRSIKVEHSDGNITPLAQLPVHAPFVQLLESILQITPTPRIPKDLAFKLQAIEDPRLRAQYEAMILRLKLNDDRPGAPSPSLRQQGETMIEQASADVSKDADGDLAVSGKDVEFAEKPGTPKIEAFALANVKLLGRAIEQRDMYSVEKIWREVSAFAGSHQDNPRAVPLELYEHLMLAFLSLRNPKAAIDVWNHVNQQGYKPTVKTYSVMMRGARTSRDRAGMEAFWHKMRQAGLQPDEHAWSIRIYGLAGLSAERQGMQALNDMAREWFAAAKAKATQGMTPTRAKQFAAKKELASELLSMYPESIDGVPRPNVVIMNSAISSLAHKRDHMIAEVLRWGRSLGIEADLTTYNALLNVSMRKGQAAEALNILQSMQKRGIQPDSTTWTVLLTALFEGGFMQGSDHLQQQKKILNFVETLENKETGMPGLEAKGYALIIDRLLKYHSNPTAANAVLARMMETGQEPTCHIYTILMTHYFQQEPEPDLAAVQQLWQHIESHAKGWGTTLDNVFFDRMIEGFARHHHLVGTEPALKFLRRARQAGQRPGWVGLELVARALTERQQWTRLRGLVEEVRQEMKKTDSVGTSGRGPRSFFRFIVETGLLRGDGIERVSQLLPGRPQEGPLVRAAATAAEGAWS